MECKAIQVPGAGSLTLAAAHWVADGADPQVPMVFLHGFGNDLHVWDEVCPTFAAHYRTFAITQRGHGDSDADPAHGYDHAAMSQDLDVAFDALGIDRLVLVGHSMGGRVALSYAGRCPERIAGLVIVDSGPELDARGITRIRTEVRTGPPSFASVNEYRALLGRHYPETSAKTLDRLAPLWLREGADGRFRLKLDPEFHKDREEFHPAELAHAMRTETERLWKALETQTCPVLVVRGAASDVFDPDVADRMADEAAANGTLAVIPRSGHSVMLDNPEAFNRALADFALG